ncbi:MAG: LacI family DNA-binding transcriptional regulator [Lacisediminihabitans sp.]
MSTKPRVTSYDVAAAAGVSRTTVSFVLNNAPNQSIPESTRQAVFGAAKLLGYTPSAAAKTLRAGTSHLVLCIAPDWQPSALMDAGLSILTEELRAAGFATVVAKSANNPRSLDILWQTISPAIIVAMFDVADDVRARIDRLRVPLVEAFFHSYGSRHDVDELQIETGRQQAEYVIDRGAQRVTYVAPPVDRDDIDIHTDRLRGVVETLERRGLAAAQVVAISGEGLPSPSDIALITAGHESERLAVCCYNDDIALGVITAARTAGLNVPGDLSVIGVDDLPMCQLVSPTITTVRFDVPGHMKQVAQRIKVALGIDDPSPSIPRSYSSVIRRESA